MIKDRISNYLNKTTEAAPLAAFRIFFGLLLLISMIRFWANGWIEKLYLNPSFHFKYFGFDFVQVPGVWTYGLFILCGTTALFIALGFFYRWMIILFFLSFTYIELLDKTTYLNHYYFISVLSFLLIFLPANRYFSIDAWRRPQWRVQKIPCWTIDAIKLLLGMVYFYAGIAKIHPDWLFKAMPLKIWLPSNYDLVFLGDLLQQTWVHYGFSWAGLIYDLSIPFLLLYRRTRILAFGAVITFHVLTRILFPIGMFPYIMIVSTLIFFSAEVHHRLLSWISTVFRISKEVFDNGKTLQTPFAGWHRVKLTFLGLFFAFQLLFPFRYLLYPGNLFWTEQGYRFSWRVMLMEKAGYAQFKIVDPKSGKRFYINNSDFLTVFQEKQMATQPDFILEYAHYLGNHFASQGLQNVQVFVESYVALNGRRSRPYIDPEIDLMTISKSWRHKHWILPYEK